MCEQRLSLIFVFLFVFLRVLPLLLFIPSFHNVVYLFTYFVAFCFYLVFPSSYIYFYFYSLPWFIFVYCPFVFSLYYVVIHLIYVFPYLPSFFIVDSEIPEPSFNRIGRQHNFQAVSDVVIVVI